MADIHHFFSELVLQLKYMLVLRDSGRVGRWRSVELDRVVNRQRLRETTQHREVYEQHGSDVSDH